MENTTTVEISPKTIAFTIFLLVALVFAWQIRGILIALGISVILMSGFAPLVDRFEKVGLPKALAVGLTYLIAIGGLGALLFFILPPLIEQTRIFVADLPVYIQRITNYLDGLGLPVVTSDHLFQLASERVNDALANALALLLNAFNGILVFVSIAVFSFYLLLERDKIKESIFLFFPNMPKVETLRIAHQIEKQLGAWVRGQLILMFLVGLAVWVGLSLLRVEFALPLAVIAGLLETVAVIGPILAVVPALIIVLATGSSPLVLLGVVALYTLIQQFENYFIVPEVMKEVVGLSPLVTIISILVGGSLFGALGAAIAVPTAAALQVVVIHFRDARRHSLNPKS
ncbi:MAG: AI-2E family transporter [bacterium]|nr:AI-2E family transporter [bacterium]